MDETSPTLTGKAATQERILAAATALFLEQGYERTPVAQVAERAGVSRATVFWHFSDKAGLFREAFNRLLEPIRQSLARPIAAGPPEKRLAEQVAIYESFVREHRGALQGFVRWAVEATDNREWLITTLLDLHQRFVGTLAETLSELVPPGEDPKALALGLAVLLDGELFLSFFDPDLSRGEERRSAVEALASLLTVRRDA